MFCKFHLYMIKLHKNTLKSEKFGNILHKLYGIHTKIFGTNNQFNIFFTLTSVNKKIISQPSVNVTFSLK